MADLKGKRIGVALQTIAEFYLGRFLALNGIGLPEVTLVDVKPAQFVDALAPTFANMGSKVLFVSAFCIILSMYGGGFATVPAYLADMFGTQFVGAIHGRLLTAWSTAGIVGPVLVNYIREYQIAHGVAKADAYTTTMHIMAGLLIVGFICNLLVRPVHERHLTTEHPAASTAAVA